MTDVLNVTQWVFWVGANLLIAYIALLILLFVLMYQIFFDPKATTAGKMIFRFMLSLVGIIGLVFIGIFIDPAPSRGALTSPSDVEWWRPILRFSVYAYVAYSITMLAVALVMRKWFPHKVKKKADLELVKPRHDTTDIPIVK